MSTQTPNTGGPPWPTVPVAKKAAAAGTAPPPPPPPPPPPQKPVNPAFKYLGLPNLRAKIPSKPWLIFIGITTTWGALVYYDRREKRLALEKWCKKVEHLAAQPLPSNQLPRKIKIYIAAPPGDGISAGRDYFKEYVKPVLVAAALDYDVIEGRRGGEVRTAVGENIRRWRRRRGEKGSSGAVLTSLEGGPGAAEVEIGDDLAEIRRTMGITHEVDEDEGGVMVIGRHTWKEFLHGIHEGWLGPASSQVPPPTPPAPPTQDQPFTIPKTQTRLPIASPTIKPEEYANADLPPSFPHASISLPVASPVVVIPFPHMLGFLNTPIRIYRYLTQRHLADRVGRECAAICLGYSRPFDAQAAEIDVGVYPEEESDWGKKYRSLPEPEEVKEKVVEVVAPPAVEEKKEEAVVSADGEDGLKILEVKGGKKEEGEKAAETKKPVEELSESERYKAALRRDAGEWAGEIVADPRILGRLRRYELPGDEASEMS